MNPYHILILLSVLVIFSYLFDIFYRKTRIPSVLMLLLLGAGLKYASAYFNLPVFNFATLLPILGTLGLVLIVFEGALELKYEKGKISLIRNAFLSALFLLLLTSAGISMLFHYLTGAPFYACLLNAIPFSVISSAIAIPSVSTLRVFKKEFIIYESSFSDILGIMLFNLILVNESLGLHTLGQFGTDLLLVTILSLVSCFLFLFIMGRMTHHVKFFLIISALILVYSLGKEFHLSTLIVVLAFGLFLENSELIIQKLAQIRWLKSSEKIFLYPGLQEDLKGLHQLSAESAFLMRTFFFLVFGYTLHIDNLVRKEVMVYGGGILMMVYFLRLIYLRLIARAHLWPELVISPRGLISVLLFLSIPAEKHIVAFGDGLLIFTILVSGILMAMGLIMTGKKPTESGDE